MMFSESIYNLVPEIYQEIKKPPMYRSRHDPKSKPTGSSFGCSGTTRLIGAGEISQKSSATFGLSAEKERPDPKLFLKKGEKMQRVPYRASKNKKEPAFKYKGTRKEGVPKKDERPVMGLRTNKNFITANAVETILQVPRVPETTEPDYLKKADYGQVPSYLGQVKAEIERENALIDAYVKEQMGQTKEDNTNVEELGELEKLELLHALKEKWGAINSKYQKMTHIVDMDTTGMVKRKEYLENELKQIESDISKLERNGPLLIAT